MFPQKAEASDEDEEDRALVNKPGTSSAKDDKENDAFFKKVQSQDILLCLVFADYSQCFIIILG